MAKPVEVKHKSVRVVLTIVNGEVTGSRALRDCDFIGSLEDFFEEARNAGWIITSRDDHKEVVSDG